jgi:hypothetical protein
MSGAILFLWVTVAIHGSSSGNVYESRFSWQYAGNFNSTETCHIAANTLGVKADKYRCISVISGR